MLTMTAKEEGTVNGENKLYVTSAREPDDVKSEEIQESLIAGFGWWITLIFAFFGGLAVMLAVVTQLYIWIWKKYSLTINCSKSPLLNHHCRAGQMLQSNRLSTLISAPK